LLSRQSDMIGPIPSFRFRIKGKRETYPTFPFFSTRMEKKKKKGFLTKRRIKKLYLIKERKKTKKK
jgi:hypothetical protein